MNALSMVISCCLALVPRDMSFGKAVLSYVVVVVMRLGKAEAEDENDDVSQRLECERRCLPPMDTLPSQGRRSRGK